MDELMRELGSVERARINEEKEIQMVGAAFWVKQLKEEDDEEVKWGERFTCWYWEVKEEKEGGGDWVPGFTGQGKGRKKSKYLYEEDERACEWHTRGERR